MLGVIFGLMTAVLQSASYLLSRHYVAVRGMSLLQLLVLAHVVMGGFAGVGLIFFLPKAGVDPIGLIGPVAGTAGFYLLGQVGLFYALRYSDASRVAPLLGLKIFILAGFAVIFLGQSLTGWQWLAVVVSGLATIVLNFSGGSLPVRSILALLWTCIFYSLSDIYIRILIEVLDPTYSIGAAVTATCLTYLSCGVLGVVLLPWLGSREGSRWKIALPYGLAWFGSMVCMFIAIALVNVVFANILQSTRGLISIALGVALVHIGWTELESRTTRSVLVRRSIAALLMTVAIALYLIS